MSILVLDAPLLWVPDLSLETFGVQPPPPPEPLVYDFEIETCIDLRTLRSSTRSKIVLREPRFTEHEIWTKRPGAVLP